jgi:hypothetical protein
MALKTKRKKLRDGVRSYSRINLKRVSNATPAAKQSSTNNNQARGQFGDDARIGQTTSACWIWDIEQ